MSKKITDEDLELLDALGVDVTPVQSAGSTAREQRIIAGFEEIEKFVAGHGRAPQHGEGGDIFERLYAVRLDQIRSSEECMNVLAGRDPGGLLSGAEQVSAAAASDELSDEALLASLGLGADEKEDLTKLVHVRPREEIKAAEEIAQRNPCADFEEFRPIFENVQAELDSGTRATAKFRDNAEVNQGDLFILQGQKLYIASLGESFTSDYGRPDCRLRVIYDNGTESDMLLRSLQRGLNKDKTSRRISPPGLGPLFSGETEEDDLPSGWIYVLRSLSDHEFIAEHRLAIHKIGVTGGDVKKRIANAKKDPTFLLADVELVGTFKLANINRTKLEALLHRFFGGARIDLELKDRFGSQVEPREWFLVPLQVIEEAIEKLRDGSIGRYRYDRETAKIIDIGRG